MLLVAGFGWAKPVPIRPQNFRLYRSGLFLVSIAGVITIVILFREPVFGFINTIMAWLMRLVL